MPSTPERLSRERPTIATLTVAFLVTVANWLAEFIPSSVPTEVVNAGYALAVALVAFGVGKVAQGQLPWLNKTAPWAHDTHAAAVAYALSLDPAVHDGERDLLLRNLGVDGEKEALSRIGVE